MRETPKPLGTIRREGRDLPGEDGVVAEEAGEGRGGHLAARLEWEGGGGGGGGLESSLGLLLRPRWGSG